MKISRRTLARDREPPAERITLSHYKRLILLGKVSLPLEEARRIVGPDCAYHLYFRHREQGRAPDEPRARRRTRRRHK